MVDDVLEAQHSLQRATILRVYNYYRILISFLFLVLSLNPNFNAFVGKVNPELLRATSIGYLVLNLIAGLASFFVSARWLANTTPSFCYSGVGYRFPDPANFRQRWRQFRSRQLSDFYLCLQWQSDPGPGFNGTARHCVYPGGVRRILSVLFR